MFPVGKIYFPNWKPKIEGLSGVFCIFARYLAFQYPEKRLGKSKIVLQLNRCDFSYIFLGSLVTMAFQLTNSMINLSRLRFISLDFCENRRFISLDFFFFGQIICLDNFDLLFFAHRNKAFSIIGVRLRS